MKKRRMERKWINFLRTMSRFRFEWFHNLIRMNKKVKKTTAANLSQQKCCGYFSRIDWWMNVTYLSFFVRLQPLFKACNWCSNMFCEILSTAKLSCVDLCASSMSPWGAMGKIHILMGCFIQKSKLPPTLSYLVYRYRQKSTQLSSKYYCIPVKKFHTHERYDKIVALPLIRPAVAI